jgi:hypothetical protein
MTQKKELRARWNAAATAFAVSLALAAILVVAYLRNVGPSPSPISIPVFVIFVGMFAAFCHLRNLWMFFGGAVAGLALGALSSVGLIGQDVRGTYLVIVDTMLLFFLIGACAGGFFEFVFFLHRIVSPKRGA